MSDRELIPRWLPIVAIAIYAICALTWWVDEHWRPEWDSAIYLLLARSLAEGEGYRYLGNPFFLRPPALPWLLSFASSGGEFDFAVLNRLFNLSGVAVVAATYWMLKKSYGRGWALGVALLTGTSPLFVDRINWILTDFPALALLLPALLFIDRAASDAKRSRAGVWFAVFGALLLVMSIYLRSSSLVALPAIAAIYFQRRRGWKRLLGLLPAALVLVLVVPWFSYARSAALEAERPSEQLLLFDYTTAMFHVNSRDPDSAILSISDWGERISSNSKAIGKGLAKSVVGSDHPVCIALLVAGVAVGFAMALRRGPTLFEWFALAYAAVLILYFTYGARLLVPLLVFVYSYITLALAQLYQLAKRRGETSRRAAMGIIALALATAGVLNISDFGNHLNIRDRRVETRTLGQTWDDVERASSWLRNNTPENAVVLAINGPILSLQSQRTVYTNRFVSRPGLIKRHEISFAIAFHWSSQDFRQRMSERAIESWELPSTTPGRSTQIYQLRPVLAGK